MCCRVTILCVAAACCLLPAVLSPGFYAASISGSTITTASCPQKHYCAGGQPRGAFNLSSPDASDTTIRPCPDGMWTNSTGSRSLSECCECQHSCDFKAGPLSAADMCSLVWRVCYNTQSCPPSLQTSHSLPSLSTDLLLHWQLLRQRVPSVSLFVCRAPRSDAARVLHSARQWLDTQVSLGLLQSWLGDRRSSQRMSVVWCWCVCHQ